MFNVKHAPFLYQIAPPAGNPLPSKYRRAGPAAFFMSRKHGLFLFFPARRLRSGPCPCTKQGRRAGQHGVSPACIPRRGLRYRTPAGMNEQSRMFHASVPARAWVTCLRRHIAAPLARPPGRRNCPYYRVNPSVCSTGTPGFVHHRLCILQS